MRLLYVTTCRVYGPRLAEVNNLYRASVAGSFPGVDLCGPGLDGAPLDAPLDLTDLVRRRAPDAVFVSDPWHNFWDPCPDYPNCPPLVTGIDGAACPVILEAGDSQFYHAEIVRHLLAGDVLDPRAACIRALSHGWRFDCAQYPRTDEPTRPPSGVSFKTFYLPHGAYDEMVEASRGVAKKYDVLFSGSDLPDSYPARARIAAALRSAPDIRTRWLPHPSDQPHDVIGPKFWRALAESRIAVAGTNAYRNLTMRYLEIPACGALAVGDVPVPEGDLDAWRGHMIDIGSMSTQEIADEIRASLRDPGGLVDRTARAREFVLSRHSFRAEFARLLREVEAWIG